MLKIATLLDFPGGCAASLSAGSCLRYFFIAEIAGRIRCPNIAGHCLSPYPEIAGTDIQPAAGSTPALNVLFLFFKFLHERLGGVGPDFRKGSVFNVSETIMPPELISINFAVPAYASDTPAGIVAFIHLQKLQDFLGTLGVFFQQP
jgi:hypothetical protein